MIKNKAQIKEIAINNKLTAAEEKMYYFASIKNKYTGADLSYYSKVLEYNIGKTLAVAKSLEKKNLITVSKGENDLLISLYSPVKQTKNSKRNFEYKTFMDFIYHSLRLKASELNKATERPEDFEVQKESYAYLSKCEVVLENFSLIDIMDNGFSERSHNLLLDLLDKAEEIYENYDEDKIDYIAQFDFEERVIEEKPDTSHLDW